MQSFKKRKQNPLLGYFLSRWAHASRTHALLHKCKRAIFQMGVQGFPHLLEKCIGCYRWCRHTGFPSRFFQTSWSSHWISCQARQTMSPLDFPAASSESSGSRCDHGYCYIYTKQQRNSVDELRPITVCPEPTAVTVSRHLQASIHFSWIFKCHQFIIQHCSGQSNTTLHFPCWCI